MDPMTANNLPARVDTPARPDAGTTPTLYEEGLVLHLVVRRKAALERIESACQTICMDYDNRHEAYIDWMQSLSSYRTESATAERKRLEAENARLRLTIYELMEDLEAEIRERYSVTDGSDPHPALQRKFDRDIEPVYRARQQLRALASAGEGEPSDG
jgi:hypothetical protein